VVVTKAGYLHLGDVPDPPICKTKIAQIQSCTAHSIHPDFMQHEIRKSLDKLHVNKLDVFMINNPERMLQAKNKVARKKKWTSDYCSTLIILFMHQEH
jgi:aryl-alcohol dehydrogenase-like predicted oxidoreductase